MTNRDNSLPNIALPKIFSIVETKAPQYAKALLGSRPYIPLESRRKEFKVISDIQTELLDDYLERANFFIEMTTLIKLKTLYGTAFMEFLPVFEQIQEKSVVPGVMGMPSVMKETVNRLRLKIRTYAPWEVCIDPYAWNLEDKDACRYVIKLKLTSRRAIESIYNIGGYENLDLDRLRSNSGIDMKKSDHYGYEILQAYGLNQPPEGDDDIGILMQYESPERYIDSWNGTVILRDRPNPFDKKEDGHGRINLARMTHIQDAHTQNRIWGIGEAKPNEVQATMLNDLWNSIFRREQISGEPLIFFRKGATNIDDLIWATGNRIPVKQDDGRPISDSIQVHTGSEMPKDQFNLVSMVERNIDLTSGSYGPQRGEEMKGDVTATEIMKISQSGSEREELSIKIGEQMFMKSVAELCIGHINQFGSQDDYAEVVGQERASLLYTVNPADLPGGYNISFKGSNRVVNLLVKQRNLKELIPYLTQLFSAGQFKTAEILMEAHEIPEIDIKEIIQEAQYMMLFNMQIQSAQGANPGGKYKENNQKQIAQENAQEARA